MALKLKCFVYIYLYTDIVMYITETKNVYEDFHKE